VLGGGVGGLVAANRLRSLLSRTDRVVLVDRQSHHLFQPSLLWIAVGTRVPERVQRPLDRLQRRGIEVVTGEITAIDPATRTVRLGDRALACDALIVSLGADLAPETIPGLTEAGHNLYSVDGAVAFHDSLARFTSGRIVILTAAPAYKCPAAPYEAAMLVESFLRRHGVRAATEVAIYAAEPGPMGVTGPVFSAAVRQIVESKGIRYFPEHQVASVDAAKRRLRFTNGTESDFDLLLFVPPHRAPTVVKTAGLTDATGWIPVDRRTFQTRFDGVFAMGDVTVVPLAMGKPLPKAGVFAKSQAEVVARNIVRSWTGRGKERAFGGDGQCFLEIGDGRAGMGSGNFYAEPTPQVALRRPSRWRYLEKVAFEQWWLRRWF
jgi:sulfide:quinone oxidoreductase